MEVIDANMCLSLFIRQLEMSKYRQEYMQLNSVNGNLCNEKLILTGLNGYCELLNSTLVMAIFKLVVSREYDDFGGKSGEVSFEYCVNKLKRMGYFNYKMPVGMAATLSAKFIFIRDLING